MAIIVPTNTGDGAMGAESTPDLEEANVSATTMAQELPKEDEGQNFQNQGTKPSKMSASFFLVETLCLLGGYLFAVREFLGVSPQAYVLWTYGVLYIFKLNAKVRWFTNRELTNKDLILTPLLWMPATMFSFSCLSRRVPIGAVMICSIVLYSLGWFISFRSEWQRQIWKDDPNNSGKLYIFGLFAKSRNINYFGQVLLFIGWTLASADAINTWIPIAAGSGFIFFYIPMKEAMLAERYPNDWKEYATKTPSSFIPSCC